MANVKISELPAATTPLDGSELVPIVQSGTTDQVTVANLTVGRTVSAAAVAATGTVSGATAVVGAGTAAAPSISPTGDSNTGIFFPAADQIAFAEGGVEAMRLDASGNIGIGTSSPVNRLQVNGSFGRNAPVTKTTSFTLAATENWLICNGTGTITVTFPAAASWVGREVMIKTIAAQTVVSASSNVVPLAGGAAGTAILAAVAGRWATLVSDGTNWIVMAAA